MAFYIPKKQEFWQRKPGGPQEVNWANPLTEGLVSVCYEGNPKTGWHDAITGDDYPVTGVLSRIETHDREGIGGNYPNGNAVVKPSINIDEVFLFALADLGSTATYAAGQEATLIRKNNAWAISFFPNESKLRCLTATSGATGWTVNVDVAVPFSENTLHSFAQTYADGDGVGRYLDGKYYGAYDATGLVAANANLLNIAGGIGHATLGSPRGGLFLSVIGEKTKSSEEVAALSEAPYQILKPRQNYWVMPTAAPTWMVRLPKAAHYKP
mgnify:CR=1 FL=1